MPTPRRAAATDAATTTTAAASSASVSAGCCDTPAGSIDADAAAAFARRLSAVADPIRLQVLSIIAGAPSGEVCACDFVGPLGKSQPTISHHLKVLTEADLVDADKRGRWIWYRVRPDTMHELRDLLGELVGTAAGRAD